MKLLISIPDVLFFHRILCTEVFLVFNYLWLRFKKEENLTGRCVILSTTHLRFYNLTRPTISI